MHKNNNCLSIIIMIFLTSSSTQIHAINENLELGISLQMQCAQLFRAANALEANKTTLSVVTAQALIDRLEVSNSQLIKEMQRLRIGVDQTKLDLRAATDLQNMLSNMAYELADTDLRFVERLPDLNGKSLVTQLEDAKARIAELKPLPPEYGETYDDLLNVSLAFNKKLEEFAHAVKTRQKKLEREINLLKQQADLKKHDDIKALTFDYKVYQGDAVDDASLIFIVDEEDRLLDVSASVPEHWFLNKRRKLLHFNATSDTVHNEFKASWSKTIANANPIESNHYEIINSYVRFVDAYRTHFKTNRNGMNWRYQGQRVLYYHPPKPKPTSSHRLNLANILDSLRSPIDQ